MNFSEVSKTVDTELAMAMDYQAQSDGKNALYHTSRARRAAAEHGDLQKVPRLMLLARVARFLNQIPLGVIQDADEGGWHATLQRLVMTDIANNAD